MASGVLARTFGRLIPPTPLSRKLATGATLSRFGFGAFNTGSAVFFTQIVGLSAAQVGLGLTIGGITAFLAAYPSGHLADRIGAKRLWALAELGTALLFFVWPIAHGFAAYVALVVVFEVLEMLSRSGWKAYTLNVLPDDERVATQAHIYSALNVGFTLGAIVGGLALATNDPDAIRYMPVLTGAILLFNAWWIYRMPRAGQDEREARIAQVRPSGPGPMRNRGWMALSFFDGMMWTNQVLLNVVIPLWLVQATDSPHWLLAWLFGTNTVLCIFLPTFTSRGVNTVADAVRRVWIATLFFVAACLVTIPTHSTSGLVTIALVWLGHVLVTGCELSISSASFAFSATLMDPQRRGEYGGVQELFRAIGGSWAPAVFTALAMEWHPASFTGAGWLLIAAVPVIAAIGYAPSARAAERFLAERVAVDPDAAPVPA